MPHDMAVEKPHAGVIRAETQNCVSPSRDLDSVTEDCLAEVVWICVFLLLGIDSVGVSSGDA